MEQLSPQTCLTPSSPGSSAPDPDTLLVLLSKDVCCDHGAERGREKQRLESVFHIEVIAETIPRSGS